MTRLDVTANLTVELDGVPATLTGHGGRLVLAADDPGALWTAVTRAGLPSGVGRLVASRALGRFADGLRDTGVRIDIAGPRGPLVSIGDGVRSGAGWLTTGSSALRPGGIRAIGPLVLNDLRGRTVARAAALALSGVVVLAVAATRRRGSARRR